MSQLYYRDAKAAVVCFDLTERATFDRAKQWITELRNQEEVCVYFVVLLLLFIDSFLLVILPPNIKTFVNFVK